MKTIMKFIYLALTVVALAMGALTANGTVEDLFVSINGPDNNPNGGSIYQYTPTGVQSTFVSGIPVPRGLAFDSVGMLFVATNRLVAPDSFQAIILKIAPDGTQTTVASFSGNNQASGLAIDHSDNVFVMVRVNPINPPFPSTIYKFTPGGVQTTFGSLPGQGFGLAFDNAGNLFAADAWDQTIYKFAPDGTRSIFADPSAFTPNQDPVGFAFDRFGNLFVSTQGDPGNDAILKFTPTGVGSPFAAGLNYPRGLAFDRAGNLFVAEVLGFDILKFTPNGSTVFASGIVDAPEYLTIQLRPTPRPHPTPHGRLPLQR
jgi:sugar lactone lactonase YvrE